MTDITTHQNHELQICPQRYEQLLAIRDALGARTLNETVSQLVRHEIDRGTIPDEIPGVLIDRDGSDVYIGFDDDHPVKLKAEHASSLAEAILNMLEGRTTGVELNLKGAFIVSRERAGIRVQFEIAAQEGKVFARDIAFDIAHMIAAAARP
ncbi:hypothetical protein [Roseovarius sp.]|uniref:hypothetical protein n=1 Tax=Roseovarius sp. TaxID=1486281 RepID=UPI003517B5DE